MIRKFTSKSQIIGQIGEGVAVRYLEEKDFAIIDQNVTYRFGEIDIIARKGDKLHFIEVKTLQGFDQETSPFENITKDKLEKMKKSVQMYLMQNMKYASSFFQLDGAAVLLDMANRKAKVEYMENINI